MAARVTVLHGPARCGKSRRLSAQYRRALGGSPPGSALWLAPNHRSAADVLGRLLSPELPACLSPGVMTFENFARAVLQASGQAVRPLSQLGKRQLLRRTIHEQRRAGRLRHFAPIADTHGLVDLVSAFISELKRLEIWPEQFREACGRRGVSEKDHELLAIYQGYQALLLEHQLYDAEGRFWSARDLLTAGQRRPFEGLQLVVADGFTDFTRTQHEILELLSSRVDELVVTLPLEEGDRRADLFAKARETLDELRRRHAGLKEEGMPRLSMDGPQADRTMAQLEAELFQNPRAGGRVGEPANGESGPRCEVEIIAAPRELGEIEEIGRRIKSLLTGEDECTGSVPVRPGEIAVVFRSPGGAAPLVREVFGELGIPFALETGPTLEELPLAAAVVGLLRLVVEDWPFRQLLAVLGHNYFQPDWPEWNDGEAALDAERLIRALQIPSGAQALLSAAARRLERRGREADTAFEHDADSPLAARRQQQLRSVQAGHDLLVRLKQACDRLPARAAQHEWADILDALAEETGLKRAMATTSDPLASRDRATWRGLLAAAREGAELMERIGQNPPQLTRGEFLELLVDLLRWQRLPREDDEVGRVRVLSAASVRALEIPYLFFAGLSERSFPSPDRSDRLYSEAEYLHLRDHGLPLPSRAQRSGEEMLLFYEVVTRATRRLWLSYPGLDDRAEPLLPSPFLREVQRACGGRIPMSTVADLHPVRKPTLPPQHEKDRRIQGVETAMNGDASLLAGMGGENGNGRASVLRNVLAGLSTIHERGGREFGPFEGMLPGDAARSQLAQEFGPGRLWTVSHLEQYASCPYRFFLEKVARLTPLDDLTLELDYLRRGSMLHELLARLHERINAELGGPGSPAEYNPRQFDEDLAAALARVVQATPADNPVQAALREIDRRTLLQWGRQYRAQHEKYDQRFRKLDRPPLPTAFEVSFGLPSSASPGRLSSPQPLELTSGDETLQFAGRVDRVDVAEVDVGEAAGQTVFNVIDYKSGRPRYKRKDQENPNGTMLQLELYALAVQEVLYDGTALPLEAGYWHIRHEGYKHWQKFLDLGPHGVEENMAWRSRKEQIVQKVFALVHGIRAAQFPMHSADENCTSYCQFSTVCRVNHARALEKTWAPPE